MKTVDPAAAVIGVAFVLMIWCLALAGLISLVVFGVVP